MELVLIVIMKLFENFLNKKEFKQMENFLLNPYFPWYYHNYTIDTKDTSNFHFSHTLYNHNKINSNYFSSILTPILNKLQNPKLLRAKVNLYTKQDKQIKTAFHTDKKEKHIVALFSFNTNNGYTEFKTGEKIKSKKNNMIIFPGHLKHRSVNQTDTNTRINLNINLENVI
jgi:hypothetical protein